MRSDCWLFAITGVLEDSYRRYGVSRGWLSGDEYLEISRQALGIKVMELCREHPSILCPANSNGPDGIAWGNTTNFADERILFFFKALGSGAFPSAICEYSATAVHEKECDGMRAAEATNPLQFHVTRADSYYESSDVKAALLKKRSAFTLGIAMAWNEVYLPCATNTTNAAQRATRFYSGCAAVLKGEQACEPCPRSREYEHFDCCVAERRPMVNMRGEWWYAGHGRRIALGGHAIAIVGYTDTYQDEHGNVGGFILRNSWADGIGTAHGSKGRGSHSYLYYMRAVSDWDEAQVCPNPHSPRSWALCDTLDSCHDKLAAEQAAAAHRPMRLLCTDNGGYLSPGLCTRGAVYFLRNLTEWDSGADRAGLFEACFLKDKDGELLCAPPLLLDDIATLFTPEGIDEGRVPLNHPKVCGFNFLPYAVFEDTQSRFGFVAATSYDIEWTPSSYLSQRQMSAKRSGEAETAGSADESILDYSLLESSMKRMPIVERPTGPLWL